MKIYAKQVPPEYQESNLEIDTDYINLSNRDTELTSLLFDTVREALYDGILLDEWDDIRSGRSAYYTWAGALRDILPPSGRSEYTRAERLKIPEIALEYYHAKDGRPALCKMLEIVTGKKWDYRTLSGCCQSDWIEAFFPADAWPGSSLDRFEAEYFNTGTEWIIHDSEEKPETPDKIEGESFYCTTYDPRAEIAEECGVKPEEVQLYEFDGWTRSANWRAV